MRDEHQPSVTEESLTQALAYIAVENVRLEALVHELEGRLAAMESRAAGDIFMSQEDPEVDAASAPLIPL